MYIWGNSNRMSSGPSNIGCKLNDCCIGRQPVGAHRVAVTDHVIRFNLCITSRTPHLDIVFGHVNWLTAPYAPTIEPPSKLSASDIFSNFKRKRTNSVVTHIRYKNLINIFYHGYLKSLKSNRIIPSFWKCIFSMKHLFWNLCTQKKYLIESKKFFV